MVSSGENLAPVAYLFGAAPASESEPLEGVLGLAQTKSNDAAADRSARRAENVSLNGLTRRNMSRWEIETLLAKRDVAEDVIAAEVARLEGVGLIDDAALAETLVRTQRQRKGLGHQALVGELRRRHIDQEIIAAALEAGDDGEDDEQQRANEIAIKRAGQLSSYDQATAKRRLTAFLMRKGYSSSIVRIAAAAALEPRSSGVHFR